MIQTWHVVLAGLASAALSIYCTLRSVELDKIEARLRGDIEAIECREARMLDWADIEAMEELDAITPSVPPMAPPRREPVDRVNALLANQVQASFAMQNRWIEMQCNAAQMRDAVLMQNATNRLSLEYWEGLRNANR